MSAASPQASRLFFDLLSCVCSLSLVGLLALWKKILFFDLEPARRLDYFSGQLVSNLTILAAEVSLAIDGFKKTKKVALIFSIEACS